MSQLELLLDRPGDGTPELSVLMPVRNTESLVGAAVSSVLDQQGCIAEILISDDCSTDGTPEAVRRTVEGWRGRHHVRVLRSRERLAIDHLGALVDASTTGFLVQAHGDDVSRQGRLATLLAIHRDTGASLVTSNVTWRTPDRTFDEPAPAGVAEGWIARAQVLTPQSNLIWGARLGLDRRIFTHFPRLDSAHLPIGHDGLQSLRALLLGGAWYCPRRLLICGRHENQWSRRLWDNSLPAARQFGYSLNRLGIMRAMLRDIEYAQAQAVIPAARLTEVRGPVRRVLFLLLDELMDARDRLRRAGRDPVWVTEAELADANRAER
ncbi:glycosyl transferase family 2 [Stella humosa]|uniref:Glycosyl transferase family 2 n=1 Tax=Stella humosa TaxID=94 RepID=A0A3N1KZU6_9PROT|nr:glycosyltransferase family A protein [Stella humosa]ROP84180.1 glycosyl transferase family 2 [Stella humosa]BBK33692.1 hypothetical protein STHU_43260 [Stella humosa]